MAGIQERKVDKTKMGELGWRLVSVIGPREEWHNRERRRTMYCLTPTAERTSATPVPPTQVSAVPATA